MRKTDKKIDNQIRAALIDVCETALKEFIGFQWVTHLVNYTYFPKSLKIVCVFDTNENLDNLLAVNNHVGLNASIKKRLSNIDININDIVDHISYDTEENCEKYNNGKWADRFNNMNVL